MHYLEVHPAHKQECQPTYVFSSRYFATSPQMGQENQQPISLPSTGKSGNDHSNSLLASLQNSLIISLSVSTSHSFQSNRLPKLVLPSLNGNPLEWQSFWDTFRSAVHYNSTISDVEKFNYLRAQLRDGAEKVIAGLPLINANYSKSIQLLEDPSRSSVHTWKH